MSLFFTTIYFESHETTKENKIKTLGAFTLFVIVITLWAVNKSVKAYHVKSEHAYPFESIDHVFSSFDGSIKLVLLCGIAGIICGITGIAGGMVLGPLFLQYNMVPQVMGSTN